MIIKPQFNYKRYSTSAQSMVCAESIAQISFATKKHTQNKDTMLIINMIYMNASPFGILKIWKFCCFRLIDFLCKKKCQLSESSVGREIPGPIYKVLTRLRYTLCAHCTIFAGFHFFTNKISSLCLPGSLLAFSAFSIQNWAKFVERILQTNIILPKIYTVKYRTFENLQCLDRMTWILLGWKTKQKKKPNHLYWQ